MGRLGQGITVCRLFCQLQQKCRARFIVQMAGFDKTAFRFREARVEGDEIAHFDAMLADIFRGIAFQIQPHFHIVRRTFRCSGIAVHMDSCLMKQDRAGDGPAACRVDQAILAFDGIELESAHK